MSHKKQSAFGKFKNKSYCVGGKHYSATTNIRGVLFVENKSLIVSDQTINGEALGDFFKHLGSAAKNVGKKILNNPGRALEISANIGTAAASKNPKLIASTAPDIIKFVHQGKGLYLGKIH